MSVQKNLVQRYEIEVETKYVESESKPENHFYLFAYKIKISNKGEASGQLMSRHWIITDAWGQTEEVRGAGVVGQQPKIAPNQTFEYESACHLTTTNGSMHGSYQFTTEDGNTFDVEIPKFYLVAPQALH